MTKLAFSCLKTRHSTRVPNKIDVRPTYNGKKDNTSSPNTKLSSVMSERVHVHYECIHIHVSVVKNTGQP